jgi:hypothetical protein
VQQPEPDPVTRVELELLMIAVILQLVVVLRLLELFMHLEDELVSWWCTTSKRASPGVYARREGGSQS